MRSNKTVVVLDIRERYGILQTLVEILLWSALFYGIIYSCWVLRRRGRKNKFRDTDHFDAVRATRDMLSEKNIDYPGKTYRI